MVKNIYEIFQDFEAVKTKEEKIAVLRNNLRPALADVLNITFNPDIKFYVTEFPKDYKKPDTFAGIQFSNIDTELKRVYLFQKGNPTADNLTPEKRHILLLQILESFPEQEARVYVNMMLKDLKVKGLTEKLVRAAFPNL